MNMEQIDKLIEEMSLDDLCGQLLCYNVPGRWTAEEFEEIAKRTKPGGIFGVRKKEDIKLYTDMINKYTKAPVIVSADIENGPGCAIEGETLMPHSMAWGACDDEELLEKAGEATAAICRKNGVHWTFSPIIDINTNPDNPITNIRAISDSAKQVAKMGCAYARGLQKNHYMVAGCKHFPGDGVDDRNQHFCTTINSLSKEEWMETFGYVYREAFKAGTCSVMAAHIAAPAFQEEDIDPILGPKPAILSYELMTKLLKEELGFKGCIVSDALSMVGSCSMVDEKDLVPEFIRAGGDMALFPLPEDFDRLKEAVLNKKVSMERLKDAVRRVMILKNEARLFPDDCINPDEIEIKYDIEAIADEIADKSISVIRNTQNLIPLNLKKGAKVLMINVQKEELQRNSLAYIRYLDTFAEEFRKRGYEVVELGQQNDREVLEKHLKEADCVLVNCKISCQDYPGGSLRIGWPQIGPFWRGAAIKHPCMIFTSFGDPYKIHDFPYLRTYVNAYSSSESTQKAVAKVLLGEIEPQGKSPVEMKGYFKREVE